MAERPMVYTTIFAGRDEIKDPIHPSTSCDYVYFTDNPGLKSKVFDIEIRNPSTDPARAIREYKMLPHLLFPNKISLYIDGNIRLLTDDIPGFVAGSIKNDNFVIFSNPDRRNVREEMEYCIRTNKENADTLHMQYQQYLNDGFPDKTPLICGGFILRRSHEEAVVNFDRLWWLEIMTKSRRDEMSFPYVAWKTDFSYALLPYHSRRDCAAIRIEEHKK